MLQLKGLGLPNVYLLTGYTEHRDEEGRSFEYQDLDGLYFAIAREICLRRGALTGLEVRFLRKRLGMSQEQLGSVVEKSGQAVAKWEKEDTPTPLADSTVIRMAWLGQNSPADAARCAKDLLEQKHVGPSQPYCFEFDGRDWHAAVNSQAGVQQLTQMTSSAGVAEPLSALTERSITLPLQNGATRAEAAFA